MKSSLKPRRAPSAPSASPQRTLRCKICPGSLRLDTYIRRYILTAMPTVKAQLVKWGNSQAVRLPKSILEAAQLTEGDHLEITVEDGHIVLEPEVARPTLASLVSKITKQNRHKEQNWGRPVGNEIW